MGDYEICFKNGYVRIKVGDEYEYVVSEDIFGDHAQRAARLFDHAYKRGQGDLRRNLRKLLNT